MIKGGQEKTHFKEPDGKQKPHAGNTFKKKKKKNGNFSENQNKSKRRRQDKKKKIKRKLGRRGEEIFT